MVENFFFEITWANGLYPLSVSAVRYSPMAIIHSWKGGERWPELRDLTKHFHY